MKTFLVNLDKEQTRLVHMIAQLARLGIDFERIPAVYGKDLSPEDLKMSFSVFRSFCAMGRKLTLGEIGCSLSHLAIYRKMIKAEIPYALIFEDDIVIDASITEKLIEIEKMVTPNKAQVILFSALGFKGGDENGIFQNNEAMCTDGYVITLSAAKKIYHANYPVVTTADAWPRWIKRLGLEVYCCWPPIVQQDNDTFGTDINTANRKAAAGLWKWLRKMRRVLEVFIDWLWFKITKH